ncbi:MAG TPA: hypothetical protein VGK01_25560 [Candidatus Angelobacter sp.]
MTDAEILTLVDRLERCILAKEEFHHRDHLTVAVVYLYASDLETAMDRMRASLKRFAAHHGVTGLYHETLTRFWLQQVERRLDRGACLSESVNKVQQDSMIRIWRLSITAESDLIRRKRGKPG